METYFDNMTAKPGSREKLQHDLRTLLYDAEDLLKSAGENLAAKTKTDLQRAFERLKDRCQRLKEEADTGLSKADRLVREHPYPSIGVAFGIGVLLGIWIQKK
jgi:ElaB/YqjD/DUF883 family membrane-anchored ribosome-binding protein